jgi:DNA-binding response OmpR family regulator
MQQGTDEPTPSPFSRKSRYILVVEGNINDLFTTAMLLQRFSYPVCTARNARQALDMVSVAMPALMVADYDLSGMNSIELLRVLGSNSRTAGIPVIILLPPGENDHDTTELEIGGCTFLKKPVLLEDIYPAVQAAMEHTPRTNIRVQAALPVSVNDVALDSAKGECATDLSAHGLYIRTFKYHRPHEQVTLQLTIGDRIIKAEGTVIYTRRQDAGPFAELGMAVKFTKLMAEDREFIKQFVRDEVTRGIVTDHLPGS